MHAHRSHRHRTDNGPDGQEERVHTDVRAAADILVDRFGGRPRRQGPDLYVQVFRRHRRR